MTIPVGGKSKIQGSKFKEIPNFKHQRGAVVTALMDSQSPAVGVAER
jgi:hypothetical protein